MSFELRLLAGALCLIFIMEASGSTYSLWAGPMAPIDPSTRF